MAHNITAANSDVDGAVGVRKWYVAIVNNNSEKIVAEKLTKLGYGNYLPTQTVLQVWKNGRKAKIEKVVIPSTIFVHCTERERMEIVALPFIFRFMTNKACNSTAIGKPLAVVSDHEIQRLKFMLGQTDIPVTISERSYKVGDRVRVVRGGLLGLEGEVSDMNKAKCEVVVSLEYFGCARLLIDTINLEVVKG